MKGLFLHYKVIDNNNPTGIEKKILNQVKVFNKNGFTCDLKFLISPMNSKYKNFLSRFLKGNKYSRWRTDIIEQDLDFIYLRRPSFIDRQFITYLYRLKKTNPHLRIIMELPTYPYDQEYKGLIERIILKIDQKNRKELYKVIDRLSVVGNRESKYIWNIPTLSISNGVDFDEMLPRKPIKNKEGIHLICVAFFSFWHGYERLLYALKKYVQEGGNEKIYIHMVGEGPELTEYKKIVEESKLSDYVIFHGKKIGGDLNQIYDLADIGVCSLGGGRKGLSGKGSSSELKSKEYLAKGIPIISSGNLDILTDENFKYQLVFNDSEEIDMNKIIKFNRNNQEIPTEKMIKEIRSFAKEKCSVEKGMESVLKYLENLSN